MTLEVSLDKFGRVVLPKEVRDRLGLEPGAILEIEEVNDEIRLRPVEREPCLTLKGGVLVYTGKASGDVDEAVRAHREGRLKKLGRSSPT